MTSSMTKSIKRSLWMGALLSSLIACSSAPVKNQYYTLHAGQSPQAQAVEELSGRLGVGPVQVPEAWQRAAVVSYGEQNQVLFNSSHLWAGDLKEAISRVLATNLAQSLPGMDVQSYPWDTRGRPEQQIAVDIQQLGGQRGAEVVLRAKWTLLDQPGNQVLSVEQATLTAESGGDNYGAYVAAINRLVNELSELVVVSVAEHFDSR